jgi:Lecithin retinol acyltransferase
MRNLPPSFLPPGAVVVAPMKGWLGLTQHFGIVTGLRGPDGMPLMLANSISNRGPGEESWDKFTEGKGVHINAYYPSNLPPDLVLGTAYRLFGTRYNLLKWNCEHYVNVCHGLPAKSRQVGQAQQFAFAAIVGGIALAASRI